MRVQTLIAVVVTTLFHEAWAEVRERAILVPAAQAQLGDLTGERDCSKRLLAPHVVRPGSKTVLAYRKFVDEEGVRDAWSFTKITIQLDTFKVGEKIDLRDNRLSAVISQGGAFYYKCGGVWTARPRGFVVITGDGDGALVAHIHIDTEVEDLSPFRGKSVSNTQRIQLEAKLPLERFEHSRLDSWLGAPVQGDRWQGAARP